MRESRVPILSCTAVPTVSAEMKVCMYNGFGGVYAESPGPHVYMLSVYVYVISNTN